MSPRRLPAAAGAFLFLTASTFAAEIHVHPGQSIQAAIDIAVNQDHIVVHAGTYPEAIVFKGDAIVVRSLAGPKSTTIDASGTSKRGVSFTELESPSTILDGFTIRGGNGGILCHTAHPTIRNCIVLENASTGRGGGVFVTGGSVTVGPIVEDCVFENNSSAQGGGGIATQNKGITLRRCVVRGNVNQGSGGGGGVFLQGSGIATVEDVLIEDNECTTTAGGGLNIAPSSNARVTVRRTSVLHNRAAAVGGIYVVSIGLVGVNCAVDLDSTLVADNEGDGMAHAIVDGEAKKYLRIVNTTIYRNEGRGFFAGSSNFGSAASLRNCIVRDNGDVNVLGFPATTFSNVGGGFLGEGNLDVDPLFVDTVFGDFHLRFDSPCKNVGSSPAPGPLDLEGDPRVNEGQIDLGADEFHRRLYAQITTSPEVSRVRINILDEPGKPVFLLAGFSEPAAPFHTPFGPIFVGPPHLPLVFLGTTPASGWVMQRFDVRTDLGAFTVYAQALSGATATNAIAIEFP